MQEKKQLFVSRSRQPIYCALPIELLVAARQEGFEPPRRVSSAQGVSSAPSSPDLSIDANGACGMQLQSCPATPLRVSVSLLYLQQPCNRSHPRPAVYLPSLSLESDIFLLGCNPLFQLAGSSTKRSRQDLHPQGAHRARLFSKQLPHLAGSTPLSSVSNLASQNTSKKGGGHACQIRTGVSWVRARRLRPLDYGAIFCGGV